jgi:hypothetical protein
MATISSAPIVLDGKGHLLGRLASIIAKQILTGQVRLHQNTPIKRWLTPVLSPASVEGRCRPLRVDQRLRILLQGQGGLPFGLGAL